MKIKNIVKNFPNAYNYMVDDYIFSIFSEPFTLHKSDIIARLINLYAEYEYYDGKNCIYGKMKNMDSSEMRSRLNANWQSFIAVNKLELNKVFLQLTQSYNPLDNYDKTSTITVEDINRNENTKGKIVSHQGAIENSQSGSDYTEESGSETTTNTQASFDIDDTRKNQSKTTFGESNAPRKTIHGVSNDYKTITSQPQSDNSYTDYGTDGLTVSKNGKTVTTESTRGNIGVTTSDTMLADYVQKRLHYQMIDIICMLYRDMFLYLN